MLRSGEVKTVKVHYFIPHRYKVVNELLLGVVTCVDFCQGPELGVRTEDQIDTCGGPLQLTRFAIAAFKPVGIFRDRLPHCAHVEQVHEEVIGERLWLLSKDAVLGLAEIGIQDSCRQ